MKNEGEEKVWTMDDLIENYRIVQKDYLDAEKRCQSEETGKKVWRFITLAILCVCLYNTKHNSVWIPDPNDRRMQVDFSDWWGITKQTFYPVWRKPSGEDYESWCIKYPDGTWQAFLVDDGETVSYWYPLKNYSFPPKK
jgi:hypothetical protein